MGDYSKTSFSSFFNCPHPSDEKDGERGCLSQKNRREKHIIARKIANVF
jgi:hypothetical protein